MRYIVEITHETGATAWKEYQAETLAELQAAVEVDLEYYPECRLVTISSV